ncbi:hypothetical protein ONZ45_g14007 [Pleurotus djamor]|nr:hypothetical protein ONZ45_g14007 [Pleurotus djamor]
MKISLSNQEGLPTLYQRFWENAKIAPTSLAIIDDTSDVSTTYATLLADASEVAARIVAAAPQLLPEEPVCILMPRCQEQVLSQLAVLQSNACCVPIDPGLPLQRKETMMQRLGIRVVLQLDSGSPSRVRVQIRHTEEKRPLPPLSKSHIDRMTHIIHTSGTTGPPKAVQLLEKGLLRFLNSDHFTLRREDRMAHLAMPSFDLSLFEVWGTFLSGATLVIVPPEVARDPNALCSAFRRHQVSFAGLPTALFNIVSRVRPETFNTLRSVLFGGEATNLQAVKSVLRVAPSTLSLFTCYGPT